MIEALIEIWNTDISAKLYLITIGVAVLMWGYFAIGLACEFIAGMLEP